MNLYEFEGKQLFEQYGILTPLGVVVRRGEDIPNVFEESGLSEVVVKAQVLSGKRGKNNAIRFCSTQADVETAVHELFEMDVRGQYVTAVRIEEKLDIAEEQYLSITYDTNSKQPVLVYSRSGGMDIEDVPDEAIMKVYLDIRESVLSLLGGVRGGTDTEGYLTYPLISTRSAQALKGEELASVCQKVWQCFLSEDARLVEINPLVKTTRGEWIAADAKVALDDDAIFRHESRTFEPRTMLGRLPTKREIAVAHVDAGEKWYQGTAGKYIEMDGDIAVLFSGGGASIANMDVLKQCGLTPANYTEYSGNPPREKVYELTKIVLSKPQLRGLWICGGVANFTNVEETFLGIIDALDEVKPTYPIVVRRAGPHDAEGMARMQACADRHRLRMTLFGKDVSMDASARVLADMVEQS